MNKFLSFLALGLFSIVALSSFNLNKSIPPVDGDSIEIPENINAIFKNSCYGCHNSESKNIKGKGKLMIDKLATLKKSKLASKLNKIVKEMNEGEMPPEKFAEKYPDRVPTAEDTKTLIDWAKSAAASL
jgi:cytochrome c553